MPRFTNAQKAAIISAINGAMGLAMQFGVILTPAQTGAIIGFVNAVLGLAALATQHRSPRWAEPTAAVTTASYPTGANSPNIPNAPIPDQIREV